jgi:hypothetical protein
MKLAPHKAHRVDLLWMKVCFFVWSEFAFWEREAFLCSVVGGSTVLFANVGVTGCVSKRLRQFELDVDLLMRTL